MNREELIDNYIMGRMSADEKASFEQMMCSDHQLQADVLLMQNSRLAVRSVWVEMYVDADAGMKD